MIYFRVDVQFLTKLRFFVLDVSYPYGFSGWICRTRHDKDCPYSGLWVADTDDYDGGDFQKPSRGIDVLLNV